MASFAAELRVDGRRYALTDCYLGVRQGTSERGRVSTKVRYEPVHLVLDVPDDDVLLAWAAALAKRLAAVVVFRNARRGSALETLHLPAAYCVAYREIFGQGDAGSGAYQARLTLTDPNGFTLRPGGPAADFHLPAAREHGRLPVEGAATLGISLLPNGGRGPAGFGDAKGVFSGRPYDPNGAGGPIKQLRWQDALIEAEGITVVKRHVSRFGDNMENTDMITRLEKIARGELPVTDWDKRYYSHELREYQRYSTSGIPEGNRPADAREAYQVWNDTHTATLEDYQLADHDSSGQHNLYHPDVASKYDLNR